MKFGLAEEGSEEEEGWEERGAGVWTSWRTRGRRVTMPCPRGRKSRPTMLEETGHHKLVSDGPATPAVRANNERPAKLTSRGPTTFPHSASRCARQSTRNQVSTPTPPSSCPRLACREGRNAHDDNLGQVDRLASDGAERVLQRVHRLDEVASGVAFGCHPAPVRVRVRCEGEGRGGGRVERFERGKGGLDGVGGLWECVELCRSLGEPVSEVEACGQVLTLGRRPQPARRSLSSLAPGLAGTGFTVF